MSTAIPFSQTLRERTLASRDRCGSGTFMRDLLRGSGTRDDYAALLAQQYLIYTALEDAAARMKDDPIAAEFITSDLTRTPALERDLRYLVGKHWRSRVVPLVTTHRYVHRIDTVAATWNAGFVAHHYTRYLGDLSEGQIIRTLMQRQFGLNVEGVEFYHFDGVRRPKAYKEEYRARLDAVHWDDAERERVIDEVLLAYGYATAVLEDLAALKTSSP
jgi:heme oxygenase